jgi:glyoxylase-like metal-dependent hydrolase (beta-lactamase superfamily II)
VKQEQEHARDDVTEPAPGVLRLQLPIEMPGLGHVNAYVLRDDRGAALVDPGLPGQASYRALLRRLADAGLRVRDIHTVLVTHSHPDHYGSAGRLAEDAGAVLTTHAAFRLFWAPHACDHEVREISDEDRAAADAVSRDRTPWGGKPWRPPWRRRLAMKAGRLGLNRSFLHPRPGRRLGHGEQLWLAGRPWQAVHTPGHTLDHLCLYEPEAGTLLSGDHVLPTITPHIGGMATGHDPLQRFLDSLERVAALPGVQTVLPAHGHPFTDLRGRVADIRHHHDQRLDRLRVALTDAGEALSVTELSHALFRPAHWGFMAESETYAHMEHLRLAGEVTRHEEADRVTYAVVARTSPS